MIARDRHCQHPGCDRPARWCDIHHIIPWAEGGPTALWNLTLLCRYHHRRVHGQTGSDPPEGSGGSVEAGCREGRFHQPGSLPEASSRRPRLRVDRLGRATPLVDHPP
ncbi:MAG TPA: HNH endonuclease signature motif containing protein [Acidimicrobiia bacterium]|nr:HNH endonuclease signature motif containing protein [Acidimicrobiia bacterium]